MKKIFLSSLAVNIFVMIINVCTGALSARLLGPFGRGELAIAMRWTQLFTVLFTLGLPGAVIYLGKRHESRREAYFGSYLLIGSVVGLFGLAAGYFIVPELLRNQSREVVYAAQLAMLWIPFGVVSDGLIGSLQSVNRFRQVMLIRAYNQVAILLVILGLMATGEYGINQYIIATRCSSLGIFGLTLFWSWRAVRPSFRAIAVHGRRLFGKGILIYGSSLVSTFGGNLDQLVISLFLSPYTLGLYSVCVSISTLFPALVTGSVQLFLWPKLMDLQPDQRLRPVEQLHSALFYIALVVSVVLAALLPIALPMLYGPRFATAVPMGQVLLMVAPITTGYVVLSNYLSTLGKFNAVTAAEIIGLGLGICTMYSLSRAWGGMGAVTGVLVTTMSKWVYLMHMSSRNHIRWSAMFAPDVRSVRQFMRRPSKPYRSIEVKGSQS